MIVGYGERGDQLGGKIDSGEVRKSLITRGISKADGSPQILWVVLIRPGNGRGTWQMRSSEYLDTLVLNRDDWWCH